MTPLGKPSRLRIRPERSEANASGFPLKVLALFLAVTVLLGILLSWAFNLSVQVDPNRTTNISNISNANGAAAAGVDNSGLPVLTENAIGPEVQRLISTGTLQNPASFDVATCLDNLGVNNNVLMLEEVSWVGLGRAWLLVYAPQTLANLRADGGEVSAAVVRSSCGKQGSTASDALWRGGVVVNPKS